MATKTLGILGSTGSIGTQALSIVERLGIKVTAISGNYNVILLEQQALRFKPELVCAADEDSAKDLKVRLAHTGIKVLSGREGLLDIARQESSDTLLNAVVGSAGLEPTLEAIECKKNIALANKETLVSGGRFINKALSKNSVRMLPVDSEHSAIFQCLETSGHQKANRIFLTASGGPFFGKTRNELEKVSVKQALAHPNWKMGRKISVDSATLMNKGLEYIEAMWLFDISADDIEIVVHRQSVIHSMVEFKDHSIIAQLSQADMRIPIQYALTYPDRKPSPAKAMTVEAMAKLTFEYPDYNTFNCLRAAMNAVRKGGLAATVANAANERAVELFLKEKISFLQIGDIVERITDDCEVNDTYTLDDVFFADEQARRKVDCAL